MAREAASAFTLSRAVHGTIGNQSVDEGHLEGVVAVDELDLLREEGGAVVVVGVSKSENQGGAGDVPTWWTTSISWVPLST